MSNPDRWERAVALFEEAAELQEPAVTAFLDKACGGDQELRAEVVSLLAADRDGTSSLDAAVGVALAEAAVRVTEETPLPSRIGPYRVISEIGVGGMGSVYLAEREGDYQQRVAIKVVRGLLGTDGLRRFKVERQILASLAHPNIARLLDGGTTGDGLPYLVMEYVDGVPIDAYCEARALSLADRVRLFLRICDGVAAAHRSLVVHRDLKPSNILVTADGVPKLLDFGIAKLLTDDETGTALHTAPSVRLLTPEYASPEQARGEALTTASDIYSLGVLLFELLTGTRPHAFETRSGSEVERVLSEHEAPRPSTVAPAPGRARELAGDLDTIVLTALRPEADRRYASVQHLAEDLTRYLEGRPVLARPSTWWYRSGRFARRHRVGVATAAMFVVLVTGFGIALAQFAARAARERNAAERVAAMLVEVMSGSDPRTTRGTTITARELLDEGVERIRRDLGDRPDMQARLLDAVGAIYAGLGLPDRAEGVLRQSVEMRQSAGALDSQPASRTMWRLAETLRDRQQLSAAESMARASYEMTRRLVGPANPEVAQRLNTLGTIVYAAGRREEAERLFLEATQIFRDTLGPEHPMVATGLAHTAASRRDRGDLAGAGTMALEALAIRRRVFGQASADMLSLLAGIRVKEGKLAEAEPLLREALAALRGAYGTNPHPGIVQALTELADLLEARGNGPEARALRDEAATLRAGLQ